MIRSIKHKELDPKKLKKEKKEKLSELHLVRSITLEGLQDCINTVHQIHLLYEPGHIIPSAYNLMKEYCCISMLEFPTST
jgi:hypothetical protein